MAFSNEPRGPAVAVLPTVLAAAVDRLRAEPGATRFARGFQIPPDSAKPRVWWHWMNRQHHQGRHSGRLEWMKRAGIGGFQNIRPALNTPQVVEKRLVYT